MTRHEPLAVKAQTAAAMLAWSASRSGFPPPQLPPCGPLSPQC